MHGVFLSLVEMSVSATWLIFAVVLVRALTGRAPKWIRGILWGMVALRLLCPFTLKSSLSLIPQAEMTTELTVGGGSGTEGAVQISVQTQHPLSAVTGLQEPSLPAIDPVTVLTVIWCVGVVLTVGYWVIGYLRLYGRVFTAVRLREGVYQSERITTAFVLGFSRPRVYLPRMLSPEDAKYVLSHELAHIKAGDHIFKPLGFFIVALHWFNPAVWLAYTLYCRDIEFACDERVIRCYSTEQIKGYSGALVSCAETRSRLSTYPLAFGQTGVGARVKQILAYRKAPFRVTALALVFCTVLAVGFLTDPVGAQAHSDPPQLTVQIPLPGEVAQPVISEPTEPTETEKLSPEPVTQPTDPTPAPTVAPTESALSALSAVLPAETVSPIPEPIPQESEPLTELPQSISDPTPEPAPEPTDPPVQEPAEESHAEKNPAEDDLSESSAITVVNYEICQRLSLLYGEDVTRMNYRLGLQTRAVLPDLSAEPLYVIQAPEQLRQLLTLVGENPAIASSKVIAGYDAKFFESYNLIVVLCPLDGEGTEFRVDGVYTSGWEMCVSGTRSKDGHTAYTHGIAILEVSKTDMSGVLAVSEYVKEK